MLQCNYSVHFSGITVPFNCNYTGNLSVITVWISVEFQSNHTIYLVNLKYHSVPLGFVFFCTSYCYTVD